MASSIFLAGEKNGSRIFKIGRVGFDAGTADMAAHVYTATYRTDRIAPAGPGGLVIFRRVAVNLLVSGTYTFTVKVWVDDQRTVLGDGTVQTASFTRTVGSLTKVTEEVKIEADGSVIQVEVNVASNAATGLFLIENVWARGHIIRQSGGRTGETT